MSPRYTKGVGVQLNNMLSLAAGSFDCVGEDRQFRTYKFDRTKSDKRVFYLAVREFPKGSPAWKAGLTCGDSIYRVNGKDVTSVDALRAAINSSTEETVTLNVLRPDETETSEGVTVTVKTWREETVVTGTLTIDWVHESEKRLPLVEPGFAYSDGLGPFTSFSTESVFYETKPGTIVYKCTIRYLGARPELYVDSLYFHLLGPDTARRKIKDGETLVFEHTATVESGGIPAIATIPFSIARPIDIKKTVEYTNAYRGGVGVIDTGEKDDWYAWQVHQLRCFFPETLVHAIEAKKERFRRIR